MIDLYLKFADEGEANNILFTLQTVRDYDRELTQEEEALGEDNFAIKHVHIAKYMNIDTIGVIYQKPPEDAGEDYVPVPEEGWHVNVRVVEGEDAAPLEQYAVTPAAPVRVWG